MDYVPRQRSVVRRFWSARAPGDKTLPESLEPALRCHNCLRLIDFIRDRRVTISVNVPRNGGPTPGRQPNNSQREESVNER